MRHRWVFGLGVALVASCEAEVKSGDNQPPESQNTGGLPVVEGCPPYYDSAAGEPCAPEGQTCGPRIFDSCRYETVLRCQDGVWLRESVYSGCFELPPNFGGGAGGAGGVAGAGGL